jgi:hypothetical protein
MPEWSARDKKKVLANLGKKRLPVVRKLHAPIPADAMCPFSF